MNFECEMVDGAAIRKSEEPYRSVLKAAMDGFWMADAQGCLLEVNDAYCRMSGYSESELLSMRIADLDAGEKESDVVEHIKKILAQGADRFETRHRRKDGSIIDVEVSVHYRTSDGGQLIVFLRDITELKRSERALLESEERMSLAMQAGKMGLYDHNAKTGETVVNSEYAQMLGYDPAEFHETNAKWIVRMHPDDKEQVLAVYHAYNKGELPEYKVEFRQKTKDGGWKWILSLGKIMERDADGNPQRMLGIHVDISERKQAEKEREQYFKFFQASGDLMSIIDPNGACLKTNPACTETLGYSEAELTSKPYMEFVHPDDKQATLEEMAMQIQKGFSRDFENRCICKDGSVKWLSWRGIYNKEEGITYVTGRDITQRKKLEQSLRESEELFRTLCYSAPIGIFWRNREGSNIYCNPRWEKITGMSAPKGLGTGWLDVIHPDDREELRKTWLEVMATGSSYSHEHRYLTPQGKKIWVRALANPIRSPDGSIAGYVGTLEDITELRFARQEMLRTQKLESLGLLAGGIAHDFNNILTAILGNISLASIQLHNPGKVQKRLEEAESATVRAKDLTQQLLTFARGGEPIKKIIKLSNLLKETAGFAIRGTAIQCEFAIANDLWPVEADEGQLSQVIHNLVLNAVQSMPNGGTVTVGAENISSLEGKRFTEITVADSGVGIPEEDLQRIFDPYFTTKQQGSGLGLATCYSIIKKHGGKIRATSTLGVGSIFCISLPAAEGESGVERHAQDVAFQGSGRVLIMDDEEDVRAIAKAMLEALGYTVDCAENGTQAIELYRKRKEEGTPFAVVIMDLTIPGGMGGKKAIVSLLKIDPNVKAVVSSGYSTDSVMANYREYGFSAVLNKPYKLQEISNLLQELLKD